ncbi:MAG: BatD family protein [Bacteriovoracaceae bacterium]|nr:BatD family protein [Bacteriovoracaceae bacterium]
MKKLIFLLLMVVSFSAFAENKVEVKVNPSRPIVGEHFTLLFEITTNHKGKPYISFDPGGLNVLGREERGVSISTTIVNGRFSTRRVVKYAYEMVANKAGRFNIRNIEVELGNKKIKSRGVSLKVLRTAPKARNIFAVAEVSKKEVYIGEGIDVRYYLYYKVPVGGTEIKEFPKLNRFIKRFHMTNERVETVQHDGEIYKRVLKYSAKVFPEKTGTAYIDSLRLKVQYSAGYQNSPFGNFGLQLRQYRQRNVSSKKVKITVKPLPAANVPDSFTGLVGKHEFTIINNRNKHLVNEPIEVKLQVSGPGALENMDAPKIYVHPELEKFDTKTELNEINKKTGRKTFEYTYLARSGLVIEAFQKELSWFNPETATFQTETLNVPGITIGGGSTGNQGVLVNQTSNKNETKSVSTQEKAVVNVARGIVAPVFKEPFVSKFGGVLNLLNWLLGVIGFLICVSLFIEKVGIGTKNDDFDSICKEIRKNGISYSNLFDLIEKLREVVPDGQKRTLTEVVSAIGLDEDGKNYFKYIVEETEKSNFDDDTRGKELKYDDKYFKNLRKFYEKKLNESNRDEDITISDL